MDTPYIHKVNVYECDSMGIVHHSNYVRFMEEARVDAMEKLGMPYEMLEKMGYVSPVVSIEVRYRKPATFPDRIAVSVHMKELGPVKFTLVYEMKVGGKLVCTAESTHCVLTKDGRPVIITRELPEFVERFKNL